VKKDDEEENELNIYLGLVYINYKYLSSRNLVVLVKKTSLEIEML